MPGSKRIFTELLFSVGTRLHQQARRNIQKRKPALITAVKKFNMYCEKLKTFNLPTPNFPLPSPLPTDLTELRADDTLMLDVWTDTNTNGSQPWLVDPRVREGIRYVHQIDRCDEERRRLGREAENRLRCFSQELRILHVALRTIQGKDLEPINANYISPTSIVDSTLLIHIRKKLEDTLLLKFRWSTPFISAFRWDIHITDADVWRILYQYLGGIFI